MTGPLVLHHSDVPLERWDDPVRGRLGFRTLVGAAPGATGDLTAGVAELEPGGWLARHRHDPAELYYVLEGEGTLRIDGTDHAVRAGTVASIPGGSEHGIRNSGTGLLRFFYAFAVGSFEEIEYRFTAQQ